MVRFAGLKNCAILDVFVKSFDKVAGKTEVIKKIIRLFGAEACSIYDVEA
jgi:hypothetical protein